MLEPWVTGLLVILVIVLGGFLIRTRQRNRFDQGLLQSRERTEARLLEENKYYKELFELGDVSYKESQEKIQTLMLALRSKDVGLTKGTAVIEAAGNDLKKLLRIVSEKDQNIANLEKLLKFQEGQYGKLLGQKKSSEVRVGKITEQISPFLADYPLSAKTAKFIGDPIDFVHFDEEKVTFVEVKSGKSQLSRKQRQIRDMVKAGKVDFIIYRVRGEGDDGTN